MALVKNEEQDKLGSLLKKFQSFKDRVNLECELLLADVQKYILQTEFEYSQANFEKSTLNKEKNAALKFMSINFFKQQMG